MVWKFVLDIVLIFLTPSLHAASLAEKDLAVALPLSSEGLKGEALLPKAWFKTISSTFKQTSAGAVLENESPYSDWQIISLRISPCSPLGNTPKTAREACWPEVRLVWQPILRKIRLHERYMEAAGDDRAFHALYPINPALFLNSQEAASVHAAQEKLVAGVALDAAALANFKTLRQRVIQGLLAAVLQLRDSQLPESAFKGFGTRPESDDVQREKAFLRRLDTFLQRFARTQDLRFFTAFSLPEGREPAHLDEWIFLSFRADAGQLRADPIQIRSALDGRVLASLGSHIRGSQNRDEDKIYDLLNGSQNAKELAASVMLYATDVSQLTPVIQDRERLLVANTSCISCHKMNELRFDFHNFSYLEDRDLTISPRLKRDVEWDLQWLSTASLQ